MDKRKNVDLLGKPPCRTGTLNLCVLVWGRNLFGYL